MKPLAILLLLAVDGVCQPDRLAFEEFPTSSGAVRFAPIEHASLILEAAGKVIYVDPAQGNYDGLPRPISS